MASYTELANLLSPQNTNGVREKIIIAAFVRADEVRQSPDDGTAQTRQLKRFAQKVLQTFPAAALDSRQDSGYAATVLEAVYRAVLIANRGATVAQIRNATDEQLQTATDSAFNFLASQYPDPNPAP